MASFPTIETTFLLAGPAGDLEVLATPQSDIGLSPQTIAVICHPHPLFSGTMHNKVVTTLGWACRDLNIATVKFNFRGVGKSAGQYANGIGELEDLLAVIQWVKSCCPDAILWLAGFSFGSYIAACAATQLDVAQLVSIAPPVTNFHFPVPPAVSCPWLVVQGEQDEVIDAEAVFSWVETLHPQPTLIRMSAAGHFFHGKLVDLRRLLVERLSQK
jgi:alpha/beta superfamily hydrolase